MNSRFAKVNMSATACTHCPLVSKAVRRTSADEWLHALRHVLELGVAVEEREPVDAGGTGTVLGHDDLGLALVVRVGVVHLVAVHEHHDVGVLLEAARLSEIG